MATAEDKLLDFIETTGFDPLPDANRLQVGRFLLDTTSLAIAARDHSVVRAVRSLVGLPPTSPPGEHSEETSRDKGIGLRRARLWPYSGTASPVDAAWVNSVAAHAHFHDDTDMVAWAHPGSLITPVPVALAQAEGLPTSRALRGIAAGYATLTWLGADEEVARAIVERGFRAGPTLGALAAAAAAAATLQLPRDQARSAIGIAADSAGALLEPVRSGAQDWRLQNATAAMRGVQAALLARAGVTGPPQPLTGPKAFLAAFTGRADIPTRWSSAPRLDDLSRTWFKALPTLGDNMAVALAAGRVHTDAGLARGAAIGRVTVGMNAHFASYPGTAYRGPFTTIDQALASTAFAVAAMLVHGNIRYSDYPSLLHDARVLALIERLEITPQPDLDYVSGWVRAEVDGQPMQRSAADLPATVFFRDVATARAAALAATGPAAGGAVDDWLAFIDRPDVDSDSGAIDALIDGMQATLQ